jgi:hypothetical protein
VARKVVGSQTVQATAGVLQAQVEDLRDRARGVVSAKLHADAPANTGANGYQP